LRSLKEARDKKEGDTSWIDDLPEMPDLSKDGSVLAIMMMKRGKGEDAGEETDEPNA
jgi:hypothetical protein